VVATLFTGDLPDGLPLPSAARINLAAWRLEQVQAPFAIRCEEDRQAARILGAQVVHLGLLDAMYRRDGAGRPFYKRLTVGVPVPAEDEAVTGAQIQDALRRLADLYSGPAGLHVYCPLGAGRHVDHLLVRRAAEVVFGRDCLSFYEDFPYALRPGVQTRPQTEQETSGQPRGRWLLKNVVISPAEIKARIDASACYISQIPGLFPSELERWQEIARVRLPFTRRLLNRPPDAEASRQRMETSLNAYIERVNGENYWNYQVEGH
jgi:LmbE family N-acetylglucosaminyl deacetylase